MFYALPKSFCGWLTVVFPKFLKWAGQLDIFILYRPVIKLPFLMTRFLEFRSQFIYSQGAQKWFVVVIVRPCGMFASQSKSTSKYSFNVEPVPMKFSTTLQTTCFHRIDNFHGNITLCQFSGWVDNVQLLMFQKCWYYVFIFHFHAGYILK